VDLAPIVHQAVEAVRDQYAAMDQELTVYLPPRALFLEADSARLAQVIGNLLNNAGKFTDRGGHIWVTVTEGGDEAVISVRDSGIGIEPAEMTRVFDMFTQVDTSLERSRDGLGLGLTLVKALVEMHGGAVEVRSEGRGRGSEFIVRLPLSVDSTAPVLAAPRAAVPAPVTRRVLIVDDSEDGADSLGMLLEIVGHQIWKAYDGAAALALAERVRPDVVVLDIGLPVMNGFEACRQIRQAPWGKDIVMVALTGWGQDEVRREALDAGFDAHMVKPVDHDVLLDFLASLPSVGRPAG
jgi:CheY-like chemotaxis protein